MVHLECDSCTRTEDVDVYTSDLAKGVPLAEYIPGDWGVRPGETTGYAIAYCPEHKEKL